MGLDKILFGSGQPKKSTPPPPPPTSQPVAAPEPTASGGASSGSTGQQSTSGQTAQPAPTTSPTTTTPAPTTSPVTATQGDGAPRPAPMAIEPRAAPAAGAVNEVAPMSDDVRAVGAGGPLFAAPPRVGTRLFDEADAGTAQRTAVEIMQAATMAMLAQANSSRQSVTTLLERG